MSVEVIYAIIQVVVTELVAVFFKDSIIPKRFIPLVNLAIGLITAFVGIILGNFESIPIAIMTSLGLAFAVGGAYDTIKSITKK